MQGFKHHLGRIALWLADHMAGTYISILLVTGGTALAATTYSVYNVPDMFLYAGINTTDTTNIRVTGPIRNRVVVSYPALSGGVLEFREGSKVEHIYYSRATVNAMTKVITLTGSVIRDLCWNTATTYVGCSNGQSFSRGAQVRLVDDARLFNLSFHKDASNVCTASGCIKFSGSGSLSFPTFATTAERDQQLGATPGSPVRGACVTGTGLCYLSLGGTWTTIGNASVGAATETALGTVELATVADQSGALATGDAGALVVQTRYLTSTGGTASYYGRIATLNARGVFTGSLLATNARNYISSGAVTLASRSLSGSYSLGASQTFVPLAPIGSIMIWTTDTAPSGWLLADGKCHTRTGTGAALFAVIGTTFTTSCPNGTYAVPDMRGRFALGQDDMGGSSANRVTDTRADTIGSGSGAETTNIPAHTHTASLPVGITNPGGGSNWLNNSTTLTTNAGGASTPISMNPYLTLNYIIRAR